LPVLSGNSVIKTSLIAESICKQVITTEDKILISE